MGGTEAGREEPAAPARATTGRRSDSFLRALRNTDIAVLYQNLEGAYLWAENLPGSWNDGSTGDLSDKSIFTGSDYSRIAAAKTHVLKTGAMVRLEAEFRKGEEVRWFDLWFDADHDQDGNIAGLITTALDITDRKRREQTLRTLLREVSHRSKNLLAIIQSIAAQTGRHSGTIGDFLKRFRGRLQSLSSSQDLVTSSNWRGADLRELISGQVARYASDAERSIQVKGANPYLTPNTALHLGLALHELAVNSVSYGALSRPGGKVEISTSDAARADRPGSLLLIWRERVPEHRAAGDKHFGSVALERVVPASLGSEASLTVDDDAVEYRLLLPPDSIHTI